MTQTEFTALLLTTYHVASALSEKNGCRVLHVRHRASGKEMAVRLFSQPVAAYEELCAIRCENLPLIYDVIELSDGQAVLEEWINGATVADIMATERYRYKGVRRVLQGVCNALTVLHERGLVHRDIKPENVMVDTNGRVVLIDLNAARQTTLGGKDTVVMGTVGYIAPEQLGISQSDPRTDVYAAGVLLNVMMTGKHPSEQLAGGKVGRIVRKCTAVSPDERYQTAQKLAEAL